MANRDRGRGAGEVSTPQEYPQTTPPVDLYATSDIRFVMVELGKLTTKVDRLVDDVKSSSDKVSDLKATVAQFETAAKVLIIALTLCGGLFWWLMGDHIRVAVNSAMRAAIVENAAQRAQPNAGPGAVLPQASPAR